VSGVPESELVVPPSLLVVPESLLPLSLVPASLGGGGGGVSGAQVPDTEPGAT